MGGQGLKLGTVPFLNAKPLTLTLENRPDVELRSEPPARLLPMLESGELDGALVSTFAMFHLPGARYVPGVGIASRGRVRSIRLFCRKPPGELRRVGLDGWSLSAANMTRVILKRKWGAEPEFATVDPLRPPREDESFDAFLLIGDNALREEAGGLDGVDLGEAWEAFTGLPFLYAVWVFGPGRGDAGKGDAGRSDVETCRLLREAKEEGMARLGEIIASAGRDLPYIDEAAARDYLTNCIRYDVGPGEEAGLRRYYEYLAEDGLAPPEWDAGRAKMEI
ncbi:MAG: menaquinone biosynthesis protein [Nitrospinota bacterium]|jgi:chorismate dehydratase|nr:menaquinone biosynthesis protein [Nitrospinota bacterium]MDP7167559.1 menaquinone biosynthesis protein [Nitrospinota bacterium]MDP7370548.1 menaquinone biosynthesis protein [Nitrospinota bacterium]MDP7505706.1 menaquinone biosynthesis protein [Nitrospinota bacterium]MDP7664981.1 menaquinone biosynthesis protein [Nitrospinota bacterium]